MSRTKAPLPSHPKPGPTFSDWFKSFSAVVTDINATNIFSSKFSIIVDAVFCIRNEVLYEMSSPIDRSASSVYDRSDYLVRELLRTSRVGAVVKMCRQTAGMLASGDLVLTKEGILRRGEEEIKAPFARVMLIDLPTILALCFTAQEMVGVVSLDDLLVYAKDALTAGAKNTAIAFDMSKEEHTLFSTAGFTLKACMEHMKVLNAPLFFSLFQDMKLLELFLEFALKAGVDGKVAAVDVTVEGMSAYIRASQSDEDRKRCASDPAFVQQYRAFMTQIVEPQLSKNRGKYRAIMCYSRSLKG